MIVGGTIPIQQSRLYVVGDIRNTGQLYTSTLNVYGPITSTYSFIGNGAGLYNLSTGMLANQSQVNSTVAYVMSVIYDLFSNRLGHKHSLSKCKFNL
jgi:hypothetical protein